MHPDTLATMALLAQSGVGGVSVRQALSGAEHAREPLAEMLGAGLDELIEKFPPGCDQGARAVAGCKPLELERAEALAERATTAGAQALHVLDADYPESVARSLGRAAPPILWVVGDQEMLASPMAGVVGARDASESGLALAEECGVTFGSESVVVVSGGARGVDTWAHRSSVEAGGRTVIVLPQGILTYSVPGSLRESIDDGRVCIVSEWMPEAEWSKQRAVSRNATIAAFAMMVCVLEPDSEGGSARTGHRALEMGKGVLVHAGPSPTRTYKALCAKGAGKVLDDEGQFSREYLLDTWSTAMKAGPRQPDLF